MKEIRLEVNLDCKDNVDIERLKQLIAYGCNVYGVIRVQSVLVVKTSKG